MLGFIEDSPYYGLNIKEIIEISLDKVFNSAKGKEILSIYNKK